VCAFDTFFSVICDASFLLVFQLDKKGFSVFVEKIHFSTAISIYIKSRKNERVNSSLQNELVGNFELNFDCRKYFFVKSSSKVFKLSFEAF
jgi:hypothetical protein